MSVFDLGGLRSRDELLAVGRQVAAEIRADDLLSLAAAVAFKIVLALFPSMAAGIAIFALVTEPADLARLLDELAAFAPAGVIDFIRPPLLRLIEDPAAGFAALLGIATGLWAASSAAVTLNRSLSRAYDVADGRKLVRARRDALAVTAALLLALGGIFVLLVAGSRLEDALLQSLPLTSEARGVADALSTLGRYLLSAVALMLLFAFIYWIGPDYDARPRYPWISPGAVVGVVTWLIAWALFGVYANNFGNYGSSSVYASFGGAILFMLWLQLSMLALLLGAEVNQVLRLRAGRRSQAADVAGFGGEPAVAEPLVAAPARRTPRALDVPDDPVDVEQDGERSRGRRARRASGGAAATRVTTTLSGLAGTLLGPLRRRHRQ